ncbi:NAD-dependent epimerase/dehydratase family protein [Candidatus Methylopumilus universalis]|uniref:NAD-dependent epimerase/dehydratase family protein n=1 Tax=Candidatus Methylopumilus universalis TaxID=2588536 RepID=UPI00111F5CB1|nr:NAD-dependent epimerase/dehydratase family protein [Candidatus Methylopumilus universalis]QDC46222.1 NAD-dependent epimerase/dehydratase family protein [Candidatus Methylopumilus universalis]
MSPNFDFLVTGCAGFIGSNFVDRLVNDGFKVCGIDNLSTGKLEFLKTAMTNKNFYFIQADLFDLENLKKIFPKVDIVVHLAANADVRFGTSHPKKDLEQNTLVTFNILEAMRSSGVKKIIFSSTGSVYGESPVIPTPENGPFPIQTSLYGASKVACEGLISSYCEGFGFQSWIFRFVSILGERYTHGHIFDFYRQLMLHPKQLSILGNGKQRKSYLYVQDCLDGILNALDKTNEKVNIFNLGFDGYVEVNDSIGFILKELNLQPKLNYSGGDKGWIGDNPFIFLDTKKIQALGWKPKIDIKEGIIKTLNYLKKNEWVFEERL